MWEGFGGYQELWTANGGLYDIWWHLWAQQISEKRPDPQFQTGFGYGKGTVYSGQKPVLSLLLHSQTHSLSYPSDPRLQSGGGGLWMACLSVPTMQNCPRPSAPLSAAVWDGSWVSESAPSVGERPALSRQPRQSGSWRGELQPFPVQARKNLPGLTQSSSNRHLCEGGSGSL